MEKTVSKQETPDWFDLLEEAVKAPGQLSSAHRFFKKYSLINRWLAASQLRKLGLPLMPINTYGTKDKATGKGLTGWLGANRHVKAGETASISLIMPVPVKKSKKDAVDPDEKEVVFTRFMLRRAWFHLGQTDGEEYVVDNTSTEWDVKYVLEFFNIQETAFQFRNVSDTRLGYASVKKVADADVKEIAVSPLAEYPAIGRLREISRILLGHCDATPAKRVPEDPVVRELEVDAAAYLVAATLGFDGLDTVRASLQSGLNGADAVSAQVAQRAFGVADKILNAGAC